MKTKIASKLPSIDALRWRISIIEERIEKCEGGIPKEFWCDNCKRLLKKIESLEEKKKIIKEENLAYAEAFKVGTYLADGGFSRTASTYKYKCSGCGRVFDNDQHLWPPLGVILDADKKLRCYACANIVEEINSQPTIYKCSQCGRTWVIGKRTGIYRDVKTFPNVDRCSTCNGIVEEIKPGNKTQ